ncbi:MAG: transcriptional repressor [Spirochaetales bacterium]|nr:transcriptional repressor [Spirochaetales bacterium]
MICKLTKKRQRILSIINGSSVPLSAGDVHALLKKAVNLATIYRGLHYLELQHRIEGFTILCTREGAVRYYFKKENPHLHFIHCEVCHTFSPFRGCLREKLMNKIASELDYSIHSHVLYLTGVCGSCKRSN